MIDSETGTTPYNWYKFLWMSGKKSLVNLLCLHTCYDHRFEVLLTSFSFSNTLTLH
jgi:hypothetical protein